MNAVIKVENLGKKYIIGHQKQLRYQTLRDTITHTARSIWQRVRHPLSPNRESVDLEELWALKDVNFEVQQGERVGIIGANGAGKSTLLKILCRITEPTTGKTRIKGRVSSLLEVGTGFHHELTGRENIFLNGAILGMTKQEIRKKFDEIVAFAELEKFLDTPVKRYSSGMYVRLAFAVAAHLEPEILLVDEVLAVGDAAFKKKCLGKMGDVAKEGRTVLFVSHNMVAMQSLCPRVIWLGNGETKRDGQANQVISDYLQSNALSRTEQAWDDIEIAPGNDVVRLHRVRVRPENGLPSRPITMKMPILIEAEFWNLVPDAHLHVTLHLYNEQQIVAFSTGSSIDPVWRNRTFPVGLFRSVCQIPGNFLNSGIHRIVLLVVQNKDTVIYRHEDVVSFDVLDSDKRQGGWYGKEPGVVCPKMKWTTEYIGSLAEAPNLTNLTNMKNIQ